MIIDCCVCDRCAKPVPQGTGAVVMKHTDAEGTYPTMHLCDNCFGEVFTLRKRDLMEKLKGGCP